MKNSNLEFSGVNYQITKKKEEEEEGSRVRKKEEEVNQNSGFFLSHEQIK